MIGLARATFGLSLVVIVFGACSGEPPVGAAQELGCQSDLDCRTGERCRLDGVCELSSADPSPNPQPGTAPEPDPETAPEPEASPTPEPSAVPPTDPDGGCVATEEVCDGEDNDCDGEVDEDVANACGGCAPLDVGPGEACGVCGEAVCDGSDAIECREQPSNACGGCNALAHLPGDECGQCGQYQCEGETALECVDSSACNVVRFIAMGDTGEANETQYRVSAGAQLRCDRAGGCDGFIMLGDNIYDTGAESPTDAQLTTKIDEPYRNLRAGPPPVEGDEDLRPRMPIYVSLGNHDLGGAGLNNAQVAHYLEYARQHDWFFYPDEFFDVRVGSVHLISLHTNPLAYLGNLMEAQGDLVDNVVNQSDATWTLAFGHHPYRSDGQHGNAGSYEGIPGDLFFLGGQFRQWVDDYICNRVDFYLSGHDHSRQWLASVPDIPTWPLFADGRVPCATHFAVSGAGAKTDELVGRDNDLDFGAETPGFALLEFHADHAVVEFCDADGETEWTKTIMR